MLYNVDDYGASFEIEFSIPSDYHLYSSLKSISKNTLYATNFDYMITDRSPAIWEITTRL